MGYGDFQLYDIIIFAGIAAFLVFRLRNVLGKRTGLERTQKGMTKQPKKAANNKVEEKDIPELDNDFAELRKAYEALENFDHKNFLDGARAAFETIINSFNNSDKKALKNLLTEDVYHVFEKAIDEKRTDKESQIFSLNIEKIEEVKISQEKIIIKTKFISEHFKNNDEATIIKKEDLWSFEKNIKSKDPKWLLCST